MKKRMLAFLMAGVMMLSVTGCGSNKAKSYSKYVELGEYKGIEYVLGSIEVTEDEVQAELDTFAEGLAESKEITGRAIKDGDIVNIDYVGTKDGVAFDGGTAEGRDLEIGSNSFIDGFEDGLIGHEIGEKVSLDLTFPDTYDNEELAGQDVVFDVTINSITEETIPEVTDELVKDNTDYETVDAYIDSIKENLTAEKQTTVESQAKNDIFNKVVQNCTVSGFDEAEVNQLIDDEFESFKEMAASYESYGYSYEDVLAVNGYETEDDLKEGITEYVKNYLTQKMIIYVIADKENIKVTGEEISNEVQEYMTLYSVETEEEVYEYFGDEYFELALLSEKVMAFLQENAVQVESLEETTEEAAEATTEAE